MPVLFRIQRIVEWYVRVNHFELRVPFHLRDRVAAPAADVTDAPPRFAVRDHLEHLTFEAVQVLAPRVAVHHREELMNVSTTLKTGAVVESSTLNGATTMTGKTGPATAKVIGDIFAAARRDLKAVRDLSWEAHEAWLVVATITTHPIVRVAHHRKFLGLGVVGLRLPELRELLPQPDHLFAFMFVLYNKKEQALDNITTLRRNT